LEDQTRAPKISLDGIEMDINGKKKNLAVNSAIPIFCDMQYGGGFDFPGIDGLSINKGRTIFTIANGIYVSSNLADLEKGMASISISADEIVWPADRPDQAFVGSLTALTKERISSSHIPVLMIKDPALTDISLITGNFSAYYSAKEGFYWINISGYLDAVQPEINTDITVRSAPVAILESEELGSKEYAAYWKAGGVGYKLNVYCSSEDETACKSEAQLKKYLAEIVYAGGRGAKN
jgi:hypothetical protein